MAVICTLDETPNSRDASRLRALEGTGPPQSLTDKTIQARSLASPLQLDYELNKATPTRLLDVARCHESLEHHIVGT